MAHRLWQKLLAPMPRLPAWLITFLFVNFAWVFFRAKTLDDAQRVIDGMLDFGSALNCPIELIPTAGLAWGGWLSDVLLSALPGGLAPHAPTYLAIVLAFAIIFQRNSMELSLGYLSAAKLLSGAVLLCISIYFTLAATSTVFLYFNF